MPPIGPASVTQTIQRAAQAQLAVQDAARKAAEAARPAEPAQAPQAPAQPARK